MKHPGFETLGSQSSLIGRRYLCFVLTMFKDRVEHLKHSKTMKTMEFPWGISDFLSGGQEG